MAEAFLRMIDSGDFVHTFDQDIINVYFDGKIKLLDPTWNFQTSLYSSIFLPDVQDWVERNPSYYQSLKDCQHNPAIIHFVYFKPWLRKEKKTKFDLKFIQSSYSSFGLSKVFLRHLMAYFKKSIKRKNSLPKIL